MEFMFHIAYVWSSVLDIPDIAAIFLILALLVSAVVAGKNDSRRVGVGSTRVLMATFAMSLLVLYSVVLGPAARGSLFAIDRLSAIMLVLVTGVSSMVHAFAMRYMNADPQYGRFFMWLGFVTASVCTVVLANNLITLAIGWIGTSIGLYALQTHYRQRPSAIDAARLMRRAHRIGDVALVGACVVLFFACDTLRIDAVLAAVTRLSPVVTTIVVALLAVAAFSKSAQIPLQFWLPETMEAPTPVSALMHAGIVNAGGFLLARFSPLVVHAPAVPIAIFFVGAGTAIWGTACMLVRPDVKRGLAYSTVGQMGYMTMQCGIGAFPAAILHLVAHGIFKATLFLGSGYAIHDHKRALRAPTHATKRHPAVGAALALIIVPLSAMAVLHSPIGASLPSYGWILMAFASLTSAQTVFAIVDRGGVLIAAMVSAIALVALPAYALFIGSFDRFLGTTVEASVQLVPDNLAIVVVVFFGFALVVGWGIIRIPPGLRDRVYVWLLSERLPLGILTR